VNGFGVQNGYKHSRSPTVSHETMKVMGKAISMAVVEVKAD